MIYCMYILKRANLYIANVSIFKFHIQPKKKLLPPAYACKGNKHLVKIQLYICCLPLCVLESSGAGGGVVAR
jgi:hypothetical protein